VSLKVRTGCVTAQLRDVELIPIHRVGCSRSDAATIFETSHSESSFRRRRACVTSQPLSLVNAFAVCCVDLFASSLGATRCTSQDLTIGQSPSMALSGARARNPVVTPGHKTKRMTKVHAHTQSRECFLNRRPRSSASVIASD
jgi:hypothetical protein